MHIHAERGPQIWEYLFDYGPQSDTAQAFYLVEAENKQPAGYVAIAANSFGDGLVVSEASTMDYHTASAVLAFCRQLAQERNKSYLRLKLPQSCDLVRVAEERGAQQRNTEVWHQYAWQLFIPDTALLLREISPMLEQRLARSMFAGMTGTFMLDAHREAITLSFEDW